jgi:hypothetical protein
MQQLIAKYHKGIGDSSKQFTAGIAKNFFPDSLRNQGSNLIEKVRHAFYARIPGFAEEALNPFPDYRR